MYWLTVLILQPFSCKLKTHLATRPLFLVFHLFHLDLTWMCS
jgi:hypothetical protein